MVSEVGGGCNHIAIHADGNHTWEARSKNCFISLGKFSWMLSTNTTCKCAVGVDLCSVMVLVLLHA